MISVLIRLEKERASINARPFFFVYHVESDNVTYFVFLQENDGEAERLRRDLRTR